MFLAAQPLMGRQQSNVGPGFSGEESTRALSTGLDQLAKRNFAAAAETLADVVARKQLLVQQLRGKVEAADALNRESKLLQQAMIGAGSALRVMGRYAEALEFFEAACELSDATDTQSTIDLDRLAAVELAAAECAAGAGLHEKSMAYCDAVLSRSAKQNPTQADLSQNAPGLFRKAHQTWIRSALALSRTKQAWERFKEVVELDRIEASEWQELALTIGLAALSGNEPAIAQIAFRWYLKYAVEVDPNSPLKRETALLGIAWAAAKGAEPYEVAATRLLDFVLQFPDSKDAPKALLVGGGCLERCQKFGQAAEAYQKLLDQYPQSVEAVQATEHLLRLMPAVELTENLLRSVRVVAAGDNVPPTMIEALAMAAVNDGDERLWAKLVKTVDSNPNCGQHIANTLARLVASDFASEAERLAVHVLSSKELSANIDSSRQDGSCPVEQCCRWAASRGKWNLLALAGKQAIQDKIINKYNTLTLRLMAEGAMQSADLSTAKELVDCLIQQRGNRDFDTLLRSAEIRLAVDSKEAAAQAIETADQTAISDHERSLAMVLRAQWFIRDARMIEARDSLERVVRGTGVTDEVKARAQWLLGETYFLQRQFVEAINHYRLVEPLDESGTWTASALLQAGRSFEQLGRQREAAVCYTGLMTRFSDSPHLQVAQTRLAALGTDNSSLNNESANASGRTETLR